MADRPSGMRDLREKREPAEATGGRRAGRQRRRLLPWWLDFVLEFSKPAVVLGLLLIAVLTLGLLGARAVVQDRRDDAMDGQPGGGDSVYETEVYAPNYGQELSAAMKLRLARYGIPLHIGPRGVPLLEDRLTGQVREATELELTIPETAETMRESLNPDVAGAPAPGGSKVNWVDPQGFEGFPTPQPLSRINWFVEQETRLDDAVRDLSLGVAHIVQTDYRRWDDDWGRDLSAIAEAIAARYAWGDDRYWLLAGGVSYCDPALERLARGGVTDGCPSAELEQSVVNLWTSVGHTVEAMRLMGEAAQLRYDRRTGHLYHYADVLEYQVRNARRIDSGMAEIQRLLGEFRQQASEEGFYVHVWLP